MASPPCASASAWVAPSCGRTSMPESSLSSVTGTTLAGYARSFGELPDEVVTQALVRDIDLGAGTLALITLDNGKDHTPPSTLGAPGPMSLNAPLATVAAPAAAGAIAPV